MRYLRFCPALVLAGLLALGSGSTAFAQNTGGVTAARFLDVGMGARSAGLGGAYTAVAEGALANYWNPAGLAGSRNGEVLLSHFSWLQDVSMEYAAVVTPISEGTSLGASFLYVNYGDIEGYENNNSTGLIKAYDYAAALSVGHQVADNVAAGLTVKYVSEGLGDVKASALAIDLGVLLKVREARFAAALTNLGQKMTFITESEKLPTAARFGGAFYSLGGALLTSLDVEVPFDGELTVRNGLEYNFRGAYFLRGGYEFFPSQSERNYASGLTLGGGLRMGNYEINYSFSPEEQLSSETIHRMSFTVRFGK